MKKVNFDALRQLKAPEELIDRTLRAAEAAEEQKSAPVPAPAPFRWRRAAIAASVLLALGMSVLAYFYIRNIDATPMLVAPATAGSEHPSDAAVIPTDDATAPSAPDASVLPSGEPTVNPFHGASVSPTVLPTATPTQTLTEPATAPTEPPVIPTDAPTVEVPTYPPVTEPIEPVEPWEPPYEVPTGTEWSDPHPGEIPGLPDETVTLRATFDASLLTGSKRVYCAIYEDGVRELIGGDRFSATHEAWIVSSYGGYVTVEYEAPRSLFPGWKMYRVEFYNEDGTTVAASGRYLA